MSHTSSAKPCSFNWQPYSTPESISALADEIISTGQKAENEIASIESGKHSFENTIGVLEQDSALNLSRSHIISLMSMVHPSKDVRDSAHAAQEKISAYYVDRGMNKNVYKSIVEYKNKQEQLTGEKERLLSRTIRDFKRQGLQLKDDDYEKVKTMKKRISELQVKFQANVNEDNSKVLFTRDELKGVSEEFISSLEKGSELSSNGQEQFVVTTQYPHYFAVMDRCVIPETRKRLQNAFDSRCINTNTSMLEETLALRHDVSEILGYPNHGAYVLEVRMAKDPSIVLAFLEQVSKELDSLAKNELEEMKKLKIQELNEKSDVGINSWDFRYYVKRIEEKQYQVDHEKIKEYFPIDKVVNGVLQIYQDILGLKFSKQENPAVWFEDVTLWEVYDEKTNDFVGHFYMDMHPREGKYGHACMAPLVPGYAKQDGSRQTPVAAIICNFPKPTQEKPSLLQFEDVETFFHEFGHVMHEICSVTQFPSHHGCGDTETDFVEAPSQMLENWCYESEVLERISGHFQDESKKLPTEFVEKLKLSKNANVGLLTKRQLVFGMLDMKIHSQKNSNTQQLCYSLQNEIQMVQPQPDTNFAASFGHIMGGYDAGYYGYMFSKVFALDMFYSVFKSKGVLNKECGLHYRKTILEPGSSKDGFEMLSNFLGRVPSANAFLSEQGVEVDKTKPNEIDEIMAKLAVITENSKKSSKL